MTTWCDPCSTYHAHADVADGTCPTCGGEVAEVHEEEVRTVGQSAPWHFWVVVVALAAYLIWRAVVGVQWAFERF